MKDDSWPLIEQPGLSDPRKRGTETGGGQKTGFLPWGSNGLWVEHSVPGGSMNQVKSSQHRGLGWEWEERAADRLSDLQ